MIEIFNDFYKKVLGFFQPQEKENLKEIACNRLKLVLMQDRTNLTPQLLERMRGELIDLLSKYVEMDRDALELNFEQEGDSMALMLSIPVLRAKEEEEIQALIEAEEANKEEAKAKEEEAFEGIEDEEEASEESEEEVEETDEDIDIEIEEEICSCSSEDDEGILEASDEFEEEIEDAPSKEKPKKKD